MTAYTILDRTFELGEDAKIALEKYTARIEGAIQKYGQDPDERDDIFLRIREKLDRASHEHETIPLDTIIRIMSEIGEPEEIFQYADQKAKVRANESKITKADVKDFFRREFHRNQKTGIILGVCSGLAETFDINPIWVRIFFILFTIAYGSGVIVYILLALLMPDASRSRWSDEHIPAERKIEQQANEFAEDVQSRVLQYSDKNEWVFSRIFGIIMAFFGFFARIIWVAIRFGFFAIIAGWLAFGAVGLIVWGAFISTDLILDMQELFRYIPWYVGWIAAIAGGAAIVLAAMSGARAFGRNVGNGWVVLGCLLVWGVALFVWVQTFFGVAPHYVNEYEKTATQTFPIASGSTVSIEILSEQRNRDFHLDIDDQISRVTFSRSDDSAIHITQSTSVRAGSKDEGQHILDRVISMSASLSGTRLQIIQASEEDFQETVPFAFLRRNIMVAIPTNIAITTPESRVRYGGLEPSNEMRTLGIYDCTGLTARYDSLVGAFVCRDERVSLRDRIVGSWVTPVEWDMEQEEGFVLRADGSAATINMTTLTYVSWNMEDGWLVLQGTGSENGTSSSVNDRFRVMQVTPDTLKLKSSGHTLEYTRKNHLINRIP